MVKKKVENKIQPQSAAPADPSQQKTLCELYSVSETIPNFSLNKKLCTSIVQYRRKRGNYAPSVYEQTQCGTVQCLGYSAQTPLATPRRFSAAIQCPSGFELQFSFLAAGVVVSLPIGSRKASTATICSHGTMSCGCLSNSGRPSSGNARHTHSLVRAPREASICMSFTRWKKAIFCLYTPFRCL